MGAHLSIPPFAAQAHYAGRMVSEIVVAWIEPGRGSLWTTLFYEYESASMDGPIRFLKAVDWEVAPPPGAAVFVAAGARSIDELGTAWVGFRHEGALVATSLLNEELITVPLGKDDRGFGGAARLVRAEPPSVDREVGPPWVDPSGRLHVLAWRPDEAGWALVEHRIEAGLATPVAIEARRHLTVPGDPLLSQVLLIPGEASVVLGWVEASEAGLSARLAELCDHARLLAAVPVQGAIAVPQRLGLHRAPSGALRLSFVVTEEPDAAQRGIEVVKPLEHEARVGSWRLDARASSAACAYIGQEDPVPLRLILTGDGELLRDGRLMRRGLDPAYPFPVFTTAQDAYEVAFDAGGRPHIVPFR
jgi:hypothetical protein